MNRRIIELAKQCGYWSGQTIEMNDVGLEKFAQLVIQECIQVGGPEDSYRDDWFKAKADSVAKIMKHFGVEK